MGRIFWALFTRNGAGLIIVNPNVKTLECKAIRDFTIIKRPAFKFNAQYLQHILSEDGSVICHELPKAVSNVINRYSDYNEFWGAEITY